MIPIHPPALIDSKQYAAQIAPEHPTILPSQLLVQAALTVRICQILGLEVESIGYAKGNVVPILVIKGAISAKQLENLKTALCDIYPAVGVIDGSGGKWVLQAAEDGR